MFTEKTKLKHMKNTIKITNSKGSFEIIIYDTEILVQQIHSGCTETRSIIYWDSHQAMFDLMSDIFDEYADTGSLPDLSNVYQEAALRQITSTLDIIKPYEN